MSKAESAFLSRMKSERMAIERKHINALIDAKGDCRMLTCADCPIECSLVESDDITLYKAERWLETNKGDICER